MEFTAENVEAAVTEFYKNTGSVNKEVHEWLKMCQVSREAWQIVWPLLDLTKSSHLQYLAANMLHHKVSRCIEEIPREELGGLKDRLVAVVAKYISGPPMVLTRLCLTLGAFVLNTIGVVWANPLDDLATIFAPQNFPGVPEVSVLRLLVQVFGHIPEQAVSLASVAKGQACRQLQERGQMMYSWLFNVVQTKSDNRELILETCKALNSWMKMICIFEWPELFKLVDLLCSSLVGYIEMEDSESSDIAIEILSGIIGEPMSNKYPKILLQILDKIIPLHPCVHTLIQRDDMETASGFYGMYVAFADCHSSVVVDVTDPHAKANEDNPKNRENMLLLIKVLLECSDYPGVYPVDEIVSNLPISVWYSIVEDIEGKHEDKARYIRIMQVFDEVYQTLAKILIKKGTYPADTSDWNAEELEMFRVYRQDVCDCLSYCFELRGLAVLNEIVDWAEVHLTAVESNPEEIGARWPELESIMLGIKAVSESISDESDEIVIGPINRVFSVVYRVLKLNKENKFLSSKSPVLFQGAIECISACSSLLHLNDAVVKNIIGFILEGLFQPEIATSAALAMKTLSRDCTKNLSEFTPQILTACKQALETSSLSTNDCNRVVFSIGRFIPYLPNDQIISAVNEIFSPCLTQLQSLAAQDAKPELKSQIIGLLNIFSTLCLSLDGSGIEDDEEEDGEMPLNNNVASQQQQQQQQGAAAAPPPPNAVSSRAQPLIPVVEQILPVLFPVAEKWARDEEAIESLFSIVKHTLSTIHSGSMPVLQYSMQLVAISFKLNPLPSATNVAKQTIFMLGKENRAMQTQFLSEIHASCAERLKDTRDTEFTESYLQLLAQLIKSDIDLVNISGIQLDLVFLLCLESLSVHEIGMIKATIFLLTIAIDKAGDFRPPRVDFFKSNGQRMVEKILYAIGYSVARSHCQHYSDLMLILNRRFPMEWRKWLSDCLGVEGFPSPHVNQQQKSNFYMKTTKERVNKRAIQDAVGEFAVACRNLSGSEYASATSKRF